MHEKNSNRMQNAADLGEGGILSIWRIRMHATYNFTTWTCDFFHKMWNIGMEYVTYWYQVFTRCKELVPIFHGVANTSTSCSVLNSLLASSDFWHLLITFANSLNPDQARQNVGPDLDPNCLTPWWHNIKVWRTTPKADQNYTLSQMCNFWTT